MAVAPHRKLGPMRSCPVLSVIVVSWNVRDLLAACLDSVLASLLEAPPGGPSAEIWVVDNASADGSAAMVRARFPAVHLLETGANVGFATANNRALARAAGRYVLLLNPDTVVPPGALAALIATLAARPDAAACGPLLRNGDGTLQPSWARFPGPKSESTGRLDRSQSPYPVETLADPVRRGHLTPFPVDWVGGACLLLRADALRRVGLLDEGFFLYGEEVDLCHRLRRALGECGGKTLLVPAVAVTHFGGGSSRAVPRAARRHLFRSAVRLYRKLYGPWSPVGWAAAAVAAARYLLHGVRTGI